MSFPRQFRIFEQRFNHPLKTGHGLWTERVSLVLREEREEGGVAFGEIAPTPGFSPLSIESYRAEAEAWARGEETPGSPLFLSALSCLSSGIWEDEENPDGKPVLTAGLSLEGKNEPQGFGTVKRKIGLGSLRRELDEVLEWISGLPDSRRVRLDANESLDRMTLGAWIKALEGEPRLEFIEQPLPREQVEEMILLSKETPIRFALDESVLALGGPQALREKGWEGYLVVKPALTRDWKEAIRFARNNPETAIVSTVFESPFGYEAVCRCASFSSMVSGLDRSLLKGGAKEFTEHHESPLRPYSVSSARLEELWASL